jgi:hypothetical protein
MISMCLLHLQTFESVYRKHRTSQLMRQGKVPRDIPLQRGHSVTFTDAVMGHFHKDDDEAILTILSEVDEFELPLLKAAVHDIFSVGGVSSDQSRVQIATGRLSFQVPASSLVLVSV